MYLNVTLLVKDFGPPTTGYFARPAQTYYTPPTISAPPAIAAKPIPGAATTVPSTTVISNLEPFLLLSKAFMFGAAAFS